MRAILPTKNATAWMYSVEFEAAIPFSIQVFETNWELAVIEAVRRVQHRLKRILVLSVSIDHPFCCACGSDECWRMSDQINFCSVKGDDGVVKSR